ncbi:MAG: hypothetical protein KDJ16_07695 [Hyphomicrobiales bacterium]|nr:hypothetical protein [Hyphomicrobiales bacterium]
MRICKWLTVTLLFILFVPSDAARSETANFPTYEDGEPWAETKLLDPSDDYLDWQSEKSPWRPYLRRPFSDGLSDEAVALREEHERRGNCQPVITAEQTGFLNLYPYLLLVLMRDDIRTVFETEIVPARSAPYRRCIAHRKLYEVFEPLRRKWPADQVYLGGEEPVFSLNFCTRDETEPRDPLFNEAVCDLLRLAVCVDYPPAYRDLFALGADEPVFLVSELAAFYLVLRAEQLGFRPEKAPLFLRKSMDPSGLAAQPRVSRRLSRAMTEGRLEDARREVGHLFDICPGPNVYVDTGGSR